MNTVRIILHSASALVWFGAYALNLANDVSRRRSIVAWCAFFVLIATGLWAAFSADIAATSITVQGLLFAKIAAAIISGASAAMAMVADNLKVRQVATVCTLVLSAIAAVIGTQIASAI